MRKELENKINQAVRFLGSIPLEDGEVVEVAYSGGKDSDVILQLAKEAGIPYRAIYKNTTIDPSGTIKHATEMGVEINRPKKTFFELVREKGIPSRNYRFCCSELKEYQAIKSIHKVVIGVRKSESRKRNERYNEPTECLGTKRNPYQAVYPLLEWTDVDVAEFIADRGIKCAPVYYDEQGKFHVERRLGCMCCPLTSKKKRIEEFRKHPKMLRAYARNAKVYFDTKKNSIQKYYNNIYEWLVCSIFYDQRIDDFNNAYKTMFGVIDCKSFLEDYFNIKL